MQKKTVTTLIEDFVESDTVMPHFHFIRTFLNVTHL